MDDLVPPGFTSGGDTALNRCKSVVSLGFDGRHRFWGNDGNGKTVYRIPGRTSQIIECGKLMYKEYTVCWSTVPTTWRVSARWVLLLGLELFAPTSRNSITLPPPLELASSMIPGSSKRCWKPLHIPGTV
jgi:hypothetical protein